MTLERYGLEFCSNGVQSGRVLGIFHALEQEEDWFHSVFCQIALGCLYSKILLSIFYLHGTKYWRQQIPWAKSFV